MKNIYFLYILGLFLPLQGMEAGKTIPTLKQLIIQKHMVDLASIPHPDSMSVDLHDEVWNHHPAKAYFEDLVKQPIKVEPVSKQTGLFKPDLNLEHAAATSLDFDKYTLQLSQESGNTRITAIPKATIAVPELTFNHPGAHTLHKEDDHTFTSISHIQKKTWVIPEYESSILQGRFKLQKLLIRFYHERNFENVHNNYAFFDLPVSLQKALEPFAEY